MRSQHRWARSPLLSKPKCRRIAGIRFHQETRCGRRENKEGPIHLAERQHCFCQRYFVRGLPVLLTPYGIGPSTTAIRGSRATAAHQIYDLDPIGAVVPRHVACGRRRQVGCAVRVEPVEPGGNVRVEKEDVAGKRGWRGREGGAGVNTRGVSGLTANRLEIGMGCDIRAGDRCGDRGREVVVDIRVGFENYLSIIVVCRHDRSRAPVNEALGQPGPLRR